MEESKKEEWVYDSGPLNVTAGENYAQIESNLQEYQVDGKLNWGNEEVTEFKDSDLTLYYQPENQMLAEFTGDKHFIMYNDEGELLVDLNLSDHSMIFGDNYTPDESAKVFWETIGKVEVDNGVQTQEEYLQTFGIDTSAPPGIADDMPSSYFDSGIEGWTKEENKPHESFDKSMEGLIDG